MHRIALVILLLVTASAVARDIYQQPEAFIKDTFGGEVPKPRMLWINGDLNMDIRDILGHEPGVLRIRYWQRDAKSAWILEETGKEKPITRSSESRC